MSSQTTLTLPLGRQFHVLLQGHVLDQLSRLPSDSVDCIVTSPPYWGLRDYKLPPTVWDAELECEHEWAKVEYDFGKYRPDSKSEKLQIKGSENFQSFKAEPSDFCSKCPAWKGQLGLEPDFRLYVRHILQITKELKRVLKPTGCFWLNLGDTYSGGSGGGKPQTKKDFDDAWVKEPLDARIQSKSLCFIPQRIALAMIDEQGWILRNQVVWFKPNGMPSSVRDRFSNRWEPMFFFTKEPKYWFDLDSVREPHSFNRWSMSNSIKSAKAQKAPPGQAPNQSVRKSHAGYFDADGNLLVNPNGKNPGDVIREPAVRSKSWQSNAGHEFGHERVYKEGADGSDFWEITTEPHPFAHFAVYPDKLVERPIKASCPKDGIVLDPFAGSGTSAVVAKRLQRSSISIELAEHYIPIIKQRLDWNHETIDGAIEWIEPKPQEGGR